jgi:hypothetical protein
MKVKKDEEEDDAKFCSLKVPMDHEDKDSKTYVVKINKYDTGNPEEFLRLRLTLNEQMKNHGYSGNYNMAMNLAQVMLARCGLEAFLSEWCAQDATQKNFSQRLQYMNKYLDYIPIERTKGEIRHRRHMESHCHKTKSYPL